MIVMTKNRKKKRKSFFDLTPAERGREVAKFDREIDIEKETRPLTAKQRALFEKMRKGKTRDLYLLPLDGKLLDQAYRAARKRGMPLAEFIRNGIRGMIAFGRR